MPALLTASIALGGSASLSAGDISTDERLRLLEVSLQRLQQKVDRQDMVIAKQ